MNKSINFNFLRGSIIVLEGSIGSGKTTLGKSICVYLNNIGIRSKFYPETVYKEYLSIFISDMNKYALGYELFCSLQRLQTYNQVLSDRNKGIVCIVDRSFDGDVVFSNVLFKDKILTKLEHEICNKWAIDNSDLVPPDYVIYLNSTPETCLLRTKIRNRPGEDGYNIDYYIKLDAEYKNIFNNMSVFRKKIKLDWNDDILKENDTIGESTICDILTNLF